MSVNLIEHYLAVFNPYPSKTQQQLVMRLRHLTNGAPVLAERIASALEAIAHYSTTGTPILLSIGDYCDRVFSGHCVPTLHPELFDSKAACFAAALQANYYNLFVLTIGEWVFGKHSKVEFDFDYYNDVVEYAYIRLHDHALELQSAGMVLSVVDAHRHLRSVLFEFVDELNTLYTALPIAESIKDECA